MSDSDSDGSLSTPANLPTDDEIKSTLRRVVRDALKKDEEISANQARARTEQELGLHNGFFSGDVQWKRQSKAIIQEAAEEPPSPEQPKKRATKAKAGTKRKSDEAHGKNKKRRKSEEASDSEDEEVEVKTKSRPKSEEDSALSEPPEEESEPAELKTNGKKPSSAAAQDDESDLSSIINDAPPPKKKRGRKSSSSPSAKSKPKPKSESEKPTKPAKAEKSKPDLSPDEEEIKRLQSWLLKCGIRKLWHRELAACSTSKEKIKHLKSMLDDIGMTGRFSVEKARQIKEQRELKAELEAAKSFNEQWGHERDGSGEDGEGEGEVKQPPRRLKPKGLVDLGDSGEDSD